MIDRPVCQGYNQGTLLASSKAFRARWLTLLSGSVLLNTLGCGPRERGPWQARDPGQRTRADLEILPCEPSQGCQYRWRSFAKHSWKLDRSSPPAARWLLADGKWSKDSKKDALLELCWAPSAKAPCLGPRANTANARTTPRWLILPSPVETRGRGGMGTRKVRHTWVRQPLPVRRAILSGGFDAVISLGDHGSEIIRELERATIRSARQWLPRKIFAVVLGFHHSRLGPDISIAGRSHRPEFWSARKDLSVELHGLRGKQAKIELAFRRAKKQARFELPRLAPLLQPLRPRSQVAPCLGCGPRRDAILDEE